MNRWLNFNNYQLLIVTEPKIFNEQNYISWENCTLRSWLNNEFYNTAFSDSDKERIVTAHNENPDSYGVFKASNSDRYLWGKGGNATDDKVFLLSITEVSEYFDGKAYDNDLGAENFNQKLICKPTAYAKAKGVEPYTNDKNYYPSDTMGCYYWWLRSPGVSEATAAVVDYFGSLACDQVYFTLNSLGVRPAILID